MTRAALAGLAASALLGGCSYLQNRANDALDVFSFEVGVGPGALVEVRATDFVAVGVGLHSLSVASMHGRFVGTGEVEGVALGPILTGVRLYPTDAEGRPEVVPILPGDRSCFDPYFVPPPYQLLVVPAMSVNGDYSATERHLRVLDVGVGATVGLVGVRVGFSPGELLDLVIGLFGIDLGRDDKFGVAPTR